MSYAKLPPTITAEGIALARSILTADEFTVWLTKHVAGKSRRAGSLTLGITEETYRYRLQQADRKLIEHLAKETA